MPAGQRQRGPGSPGSPRPMVSPALSGTHIPHRVQLHLHSHLRGRDDAQGSPRLHLGPLPPPWPALPQLSLTCWSATFHRGPEHHPAWYQRWASVTRVGGGEGSATSCSPGRHNRPERRMQGNVYSAMGVPAGGGGHFPELTAWNWVCRCEGRADQSKLGLLLVARPSRSCLPPTFWGG